MELFSPPLAEEVDVHVDTAGRGGWVALGHNSKNRGGRHREPFNRIKPHASLCCVTFRKLLCRFHRLHHSSKDSDATAIFCGKTNYNVNKVIPRI